MKKNIFGLFVEEIASIIAPYGAKPYRAAQIAKWVYQRGVYDFANMTDLPIPLRTALAANLTVDTLTLIDQQHSKDGKTSKFLLALADGQAIETVLMRQPYGNSVCVSTQVGCGMGCVFCASTLGGVIRNLSGGEILAQVNYINQLLAAEGQRVNSIVIMGAGEPLANYENVMRFIRLCHAPYIFNLSYRSITLSTVGIVPGIKRLAQEGLPLTLAVSLHAPNDQLRSQLMPINDRYPIEKVMAAADLYAAATGRRVTYEYILIDGVNDRPEHARQLASLLKGRLANVNLIPVNPVPERGLRRPNAKSIAAFLAVLQQHNVNATLRREMGSDIQAACGQLRRKFLTCNKPC